MVNQEVLLWQSFASKAHLTDKQRTDFQHFYTMLVSANELHNLTAITDLEKVMNDHFLDSLALTSAIDCSRLTMMGDVGTGAGFPALPIKIMYPELPMVLIEVNHKKREFLETIVQELSFNNVKILDFDWRTFLRKTTYPIDLFCARASLQPEELVRVFKPSSPYAEAQLVYWASSAWQPSSVVKPYIKEDIPYDIADKKRRLIFFRRSDDNSI